MSLNLIFPTPSHVAESYKNIQVNDAIIDGSLTVNGSIIQPNLIRPIISSDYIQHNISASTNVILGSELAFSNYSCILPVGITYASNGNITLAQSGTYLINVQITLAINAFTVDTLFNLVFWDNTNLKNIANSVAVATSTQEFTLNFSRVAFLETGINYQVQVQQTAPQTVTVEANLFDSFISMVKLF